MTLADIPYLMVQGVIPPLQILNQVFGKGGDSGGMGPVTSWRPFKIDEAEYKELVEALLNLDIIEARKTHPYATFQRITVDESLHQIKNYHEWLGVVSTKYPRI
ncbi:MAG: hypothetical protein U0694_18220 [Anaerolineae bacterium]